MSVSSVPVGTRKGPDLDAASVLHQAYLYLVIAGGLAVILTRPGPLPERTPVRLGFAVLYVLADLARVFFTRRATISCGFPVLVLITSRDTPQAALYTAVLGSLVSELVYSLLAQNPLPWTLSVRRALFYAGHHAVAGTAAWLLYDHVKTIFTSPIQVIHFWGAVAYPMAYCLVSMALVWLHDQAIRFFIAPDTDLLVRIDLASLFLAPIPASLLYLSALDWDYIRAEWVSLIVPGGLAALQDPGGWISLAVLPGILIVLYVLARIFIEAAEDQTRLALRVKIEESLGDASNTDEMARQALEAVQRLVQYRSGAVYVADGAGFVLQGCGEQLEDGLPLHYLAKADCEAQASNRMAYADTDTVGWPLRLTCCQGILGALATVGAPPQFVQARPLAVVPTEPRLLAKTALIGWPVEHRSQDTPLGLVVLARPRRRFTTWDRAAGDELIRVVGPRLYAVQTLERQIGLLERQVDTARDPEAMRQAMGELVQEGVNVVGILGRASEGMLYDNLRNVLNTVIDEQPGRSLSLSGQNLTEIYEQVRGETPGMPPLDSHLRQLLLTVTQSLSLGFTFQYRFPTVDRGPGYKELYRLFASALDAYALPHILALDAQIERVDREIREAQGGSEESAVPALATMDEIKRLQGLIRLLRKCSYLGDIGTQRKLLGQAQEMLVERERSVQDRLPDPERFILVQILFSWRAVLERELQKVGSGPARLSVRLQNQQALPLDEIVVGLMVQNEGPGIASEVEVELQPSGEYSIKAQPLPFALAPGESTALEFELQPREPGSLRLSFAIRYSDREQQGKTQAFADVLYFSRPLPDYDEIPNPYVPGGTLAPGDRTFVGRKDVFKFIQQHLAGIVGRRALALVGERRTGKTSVLLHLRRELDRERYLPIFIDCQAIAADPGAGIGAFFLTLATYIVDGLEDYGFVVSRLAPGRLAHNPQHVFEHEFLPQVRREIGDRILLLTIDEFEHLGLLVRQGGLQMTVFTYLRHLIQHGEQLAVILTGTHKIEEAIGDYWSVLYNLGMYKRVGLLERGEAIDLITEPVREYGMVYDDLAIKEILWLTACHPYLTQLLCTILVNQCNDQRRSYVTIQSVREAQKELVERGHVHLASLWQTSNDATRLTLAAMAEAQRRSDHVTTVGIANQLGLHGRPLRLGEVITAMEHLTDREIVRETEGTIKSYVFTAGLYGHWLRHNKPLGKVVEVLALDTASEPA